MKLLLHSNGGNSKTNNVLKQQRWKRIWMHSGGQRHWGSNGCHSIARSAQWSVYFSFTIGFGYTDPHSTLTMVGRFCSYTLVFFGLLFNGILLQELIKEFLNISRQEPRWTRVCHLADDGGVVVKRSSSSISGRKREKSVHFLPHSLLCLSLSPFQLSVCTNAVGNHLQNPSIDLSVV